MIRKTLKNGGCECNSIYLSLKCRSCGGTGKFTHESGEWSWCYKCSSKGIVKLTFLVTDIGGYRWHTPWEKSYSFKLPEGLYERASLSCDWEPNQKGRDLELWEVAKYLNVLEAATFGGLLEKPGSHGIYDRDDWIGDHDHSKYRLHLGDSPRVCEICGRDAVLKDDGGSYDGVYHHVVRPHVDWSAWACDACKALYAKCNRWDDASCKYVPDGGNGKSIFDEFTVPVHLCQHPEVRKWLERRGMAV